MWVVQAGSNRRKCKLRGRSDPERKPPRRGDATITVKTNPHPLSPPARLSGRPGTPPQHWLQEETTRYAGHSTPVGYTQRPRRGAGPGPGLAGAGQSPTPLHC